MCLFIELCPHKTLTRRISEPFQYGNQKNIKSKTSVKLVFEELDLGS